MSQTPIFDTNVFGDVQRGLISQADWKHVLRHRPNRGWPLSSVTALELLAGLDAAKAEGFFDAKRRISRAYSLSNGIILEDSQSIRQDNETPIQLQTLFLCPGHWIFSQCLQF